MKPIKLMPKTEVLYDLIGKTVSAAYLSKGDTFVIEFADGTAIRVTEEGICGEGYLGFEQYRHSIS